jgi:hypothetical protein
MEILTFREWQENFVKIIFDLDGGVEIKSFDKTILKMRNAKIVNGLLEDQSKMLLKHYKDNFDKIQKQFQQLINEVLTK